MQRSLPLRYRLFPSEYGPSPGLIALFFLRGRRLCAPSLAFVIFFVVGIFGLIDPVRTLVRFHMLEDHDEAYQLLPTILIPFASAIR